MENCPFCGHDEAEILENQEPLYMGTFYPECQWCGAQLPSANSKEEAATKWNSRVPDNITVFAHDKRGKPKKITEKQRERIYHFFNDTIDKVISELENESSD